MAKNDEVIWSVSWTQQLLHLCTLLWLYSVGGFFIHLKDSYTLLGNTEIVPLLQILSLVNGGALEVSPDWPKMNSLPQSPSRSETAKTEPWPMDGNRKSVGETPREDVLCWWKYGVTKEKAISGPSASVLKVTVKPGAMAAFSQWCKANRIGLENRTLMTTARKAKAPSAAEAALDGHLQTSCEII